jgi:hypothetical protein
MCVINIVLNATTPDGSTITSASGRYKRVGDVFWSTFVINLFSPKTPNITVVGLYNLEVNVTNSLGSTSDWATSSFEVSTDCSGGGGGGGPQEDNFKVGNPTETNCFSQWCVLVPVAEGQTRTVKITKLGQALHNPDPSSCNGGTAVLGNIVETITETTNYALGLDAASGDEAEETIISMTVDGLTKTMVRSHDSSFIQC